MENKNKENENKIILEHFNNYIMDKMDRNGGNKTQRLYRCCSNCPLTKTILDNGFEYLLRKENPDSSEFTCCKRFFGQDTEQAKSIPI